MLGIVPAADARALFHARRLHQPANSLPSGLRRRPPPHNPLRLRHFFLRPEFSTFFSISSISCRPIPADPRWKTAFFHRGGSRFSTFSAK
jgi:hypothetical protein